MKIDCSNLSALDVGRLLDIVALVFSGSVFLLIVSFSITTDLQAHAGIATIMIAEGIPPGNFLYYLLISLLSGFSTDLQILYYSSCVVLALSVLLKCLITRKIVLVELFKSGIDGQQGCQKRNMIFLLVALLCMSLLAHNYPICSIKLYLGQFPPNLWHNSTTIFLMPFALMLFYKSYVYLRDGELKILSQVLILSLANILIKPSYCFVFVVIFPIFAAFRFGISNKSLAAISIAILVAALIGLQYFYIYKYATIFDLSASTGRSDIKIAFLRVWRHFSDNMVHSLLSSLVFPLVSLAFYFRKLISSLFYRYAVASFSMGLLIFMFVAESGGREFHGNFVWQVIICNYLLFMATLTQVAEPILVSNTFSTRAKLVVLSLAGHCGFGLAYLAKIMILRNYY